MFTIVQLYWPNTFSTAKTNLNNTVAQTLGLADKKITAAQSKDWTTEFDTMKATITEALEEPTVPLEALPLEN